MTLHHHATRRRGLRRRIIDDRRFAGLLGAALLAGAAAAGGLASRDAAAVQASAGESGGYVVLAFNDLGMHCMNEDFSELVILPPFNTLRAQVIERREDPELISEDDVLVRFSIPGNTHSADKTNFWVHAEALFGTALPPDVGLTGTGMSGLMERSPNGKYYEAIGIPVTPRDDSGRLDPYPIAIVKAVGPMGSARTAPVVPVSTEIACHLCHQAPDGSPALDILRDHDALHGTSLVDARPVLCASCHADPALGTPGTPGVPTLSSAMHGAHADRMDLVNLDNACYACHPGLRTQCQRDVHLARGMACIDCHGGMEEVGDPARMPWADQPRCGDCHERPGFEFEPAGTLFKDAVGHGGVLCASCHGSPHAVAPTTTAIDAVQPLLRQGAPGVISDCLVCHTVMPDEPFFHRRED